MPNTNGPKRAILYARVSTEEQARSGYPLAQQLEACQAWCAREGYEILEEVTDAGAEVFRNDEHGDVVVTIQDDNVEVATTKGSWVWIWPFEKREGSGKLSG